MGHDQFSFESNLVSGEWIELFQDDLEFEGDLRTHTVRRPVRETRSKTLLEIEPGKDCLTSV